MRAGMHGKSKNMGGSTIFGSFLGERKHFSHVLLSSLLDIVYLLENMPPCSTFCLMYMQFCFLLSLFLGITLFNNNVPLS